MTERLLLSGFGPDGGGVGRLMAALMPRAARAGYEVLHRPLYPPMRVLLRERRYLEATVRYGWYRLLLARFNRRVGRISGRELIVIHPQVIGWQRFFGLCERNRVTLFVMDNGFFCIRSYNSRGGKPGECLDCLGNPDACAAECQPFPFPYGREANLEYLRRLQRHAGSLAFLAQNENQRKLLLAQFGPGIRCRVVGMRTDEFEETPPPPAASARFDLVYHGALVEAKGLLYVLRLAARLPELTLLVPEHAAEFERLFPGIASPPNVVFRRMTWETGLKDAVAAAGLVLCPSLWSAPIEGALVKSVICNGRVGVYATRYGYQAEFPAGTLVRLDEDLTASAEAVRSALTDQGLPERSRGWLSGQLAAMDMARVFDDGA